MWISRIFNYIMCNFYISLWYKCGDFEKSFLFLCIMFFKSCNIKQKKIFLLKIKKEKLFSNLENKKKKKKFT